MDSIKETQDEDFASGPVSHNESPAKQESHKIDQLPVDTNQLIPEETLNTSDKEPDEIPTHTKRSNIDKPVSEDATFRKL
jgi:hypothetical protein